jgi:glycolate oxidase
VVLLGLGALGAYVQPPEAGARLLEARERAFRVAKQLGASDILDVVVPRASIPDFLKTVSRLATEHGARVAAAGHAGDGSVHLSIFQPDAPRRQLALRRMLEAGFALGGAISAEHGIGIEKRGHFLALEDPAKLALMRRIKQAFDPNRILSPDVLLGDAPGNGGGEAR